MARQLLTMCPERLLHVVGVARRASWAAWMLEEPDREYLVAAAWLHDVSYASELKRTGLHQLDGAAFIRRHGHARLAALVAHHSEARFEVALRGGGPELREYPCEESWASEALTYCDVTTGPTGDPVTLEERLAEVERRYGTGEVVTALHQARPFLERAVRRSEERLRTAGLLTSAKQ